MARFCARRDEAGNVCDLGSAHVGGCRFRPPSQADPVRPTVLEPPRLGPTPVAPEWDDRVLAVVRRLDRWAMADEIAAHLPGEAPLERVRRDVLPRLAARGLLRRSAGGFYRPAPGVVA